MSELFLADETEWVEIPRLEALMRLESISTLDLDGFEIEPEEIPTPLGSFVSITWHRLVLGDEDPLPTLLCLKDPDKHKPVRWFIHVSLSSDSVEPF